MMDDDAPILVLSARHANTSSVYTPVAAARRRKQTAACRRWLARRCRRQPDLHLMDAFQSVAGVQITSPNPIKRIYSPQ